MSDAYWMGVALEVARQGWGRTAPNPAVGAVIVRDGVLLAEGHTLPPGQDHAEIQALKKIGGRAEGATMYVTLEPCCHYGRTPPCTDALLRAGVSRVVVGTVDPFPLVAGRSIGLLRDAGVSVTVGVQEEACKRSNLGFFRATLLGLPAVTLKAAISLDGRIADAQGQSRWITGPSARAAGHQLRDRSDAIMVGVGTVLADDPALTTRLPGGRDALRVVLDSELRTPPTAQVLVGGNTVLLCAEDAVDPGLPVEILRVPRGDGGLDMGASLRALVRRGVHTVLAEGGGHIHHSLLSGGFVDRLELFLNGRVLAGGLSFVNGAPFRLADAPAFHFVRADKIGEDLHVILERTLEEALPAPSSGANAI